MNKTNQKELIKIQNQICELQKKLIKKILKNFDIEPLLICPFLNKFWLDHAKINFDLNELEQTFKDYGLLSQDRSFIIENFNGEIRITH